MIYPFFGDIVLGGIGAVCALIVMLLILDGLLQGREARRDRQAKARLAKARSSAPPGNRKSRGRFKISKRYLAAMFIISVAFAGLLRGHDTPKGSATTHESVPANHTPGTNNPNQTVTK